MDIKGVQHPATEHQVPKELGLALVLGNRAKLPGLEEVVYRNIQPEGSLHTAPTQLKDQLERAKWDAVCDCRCTDHFKAVRSTAFCCKNDSNGLSHARSKKLENQIILEFAGVFWNELKKKTFENCSDIFRSRARKVKNLAAERV